MAVEGLLGRNDLEPVVCRRYPEVAQHLEWLRQFGRAALTGPAPVCSVRSSPRPAARAVLAAVARGDAGFRGRRAWRGIRCCDWAD